MAETTARPQARSRERSPLSTALAANGYVFLALGLVSGIINILMLTGSVFMIQIYDRVLASRSLPTLIALSAMAVTAYVLQGGLDAIRACFDLDRRTYRWADRPRSLRGGGKPALAFEAIQQETLQPFRDLERGDQRRAYRFHPQDPAMVDEFYRVALDNGGKDDGEPGLRQEYNPHYYGAFVRDPDGNRIEAFPHAAGENS